MQQHARSIWLSVFLVTLAGLVAATRLPVSLFPHIDYPRVVVRSVSAMRGKSRPAE